MSLLAPRLLCAGPRLRCRVMVETNMTQFSAMLDNAAQTAPVHVMAGHHGASGTSVVHSDALLSPGRVFSHPAEVVRHPRLTREEKRAILASWASDACAVEAAPALRRLPGASEPVRVDDVLAALRALDPAPDEDRKHQANRYSRVLWRNPNLLARVGGGRTPARAPRAASQLLTFSAGHRLVLRASTATKLLCHSPGARPRPSARSRPR